MVFGAPYKANIAGRVGTVYRATFRSQQEQVAYLREVVKQYRGSPTIRTLATRIVFDLYRLPPRALAAHAWAIGDWVKNNIRYVNEGEETFYTPIQTLRVGAADCDDHATLICSLVESIGIPTQLVALKWDGGYQHIFARARVRMNREPIWLALDSTILEPIGTNPITKAVREHGEGRVTVLAMS